MNGQPWQHGSRAAVFDEIPAGIVVVDRSLSIVDHNRAFSTVFGDVTGTPCYAAVKRRATPCTSCPVQATFDDGQERVAEHRGVDIEGRDFSYLAKVTPIVDDDGETEFVAAITTDLTATKRLQSEYQTLFENVPCFVAVINRDHRVVRANGAFRKTFGEPTGEKCYRLYKRRHGQCADCPVDRTFADGKPHTSRQMGVSHEGKPTPYLVFTAPLMLGEGGLTHVIEMALDMTEHHELTQQLSRANVMRQALVESSMDAILILDERERFLLVNEAAEKLLGRVRDQLIRQRPLPGLIPKKLRGVLSGHKKSALLHESTITAADGERIPVRMAAVTLEHDGEFYGAAVIAQDLRALKRLEREKLEAERLAAVGQTVAGLAHGIKNILMGLEGGMYTTSTGLKRGDQTRVRKGWEMLTRNMARISDLTKNLLAFSRGEQREYRVVQPSQVVVDVVDLYRESASQHGVTLVAEVDGPVRAATMDPEGLHTCLANLISNALDACLMSDSSSCTITVRLREADNAIVLEVADTGCGMDYEVKQKVFTSFFTTKGRGGTGLGLLLTRKIVQQHGGSVNLVSDVGEGTTFRMVFPRDRLPRSEPKEASDE